MALTENLRAFWNELDGRARAGVAGGIVLIVAIVAAFAWWSLQRDYQVLFKDMAQRDAAAVVTELKRLKVPYRLDAEGASVRVPADAVHETRLALMGRGVPLSGGVGFELFDHNDLSTTEYAQKINYQRALQGELARTIMSVEGVKLARVHLVLAEGGLFKRDKGKPKASVSVLLQPGASLGESQILGIQRLVAAAVPGLEPPMVTVVDQRGVTLSVAAEGTPAAAGQLRTKKEVEEYLTRKVAEVLDRTFGPGQAIVSIDVALNADEIRLTKQEVIPASGGGAQQAAGVVVHRREGVQRQTRPASGSLKVADGDAAGTREDGQFHSTLETNYEVSRRVEQIVTSPGSIRRISVGIVLPRSVGYEVAGQIEKLVTMAAGLEIEGRGDAIAVHSLDQALPPQASAAPAAPEPAPPATGAARARPGLDLPPHEWLAAAALLGLLLGLALALALRRSRREQVLAEINRSLREART